MSEHDDPYLWLEEVTADEAMTWVRERNAEAVAELTGGARFAELRDEIRAVFDADDRIPYVRRRGEYLYNFWQTPASPRGLWRRTTLEQYRRDEPDWQLLLDVDELGKREGENWVWDGAAVLRPDYRLALVNLSRGGADAAVVREFDLQTREFVPGGFELPEAKSFLRWIDADRVYVGTDFGPDSMTSSGYPRIVKEWRRGTELADAVTVFEGKPEDVSVYATHDPTPGFERDFVGRNIDFYRSERFLRTESGDLLRIDVPDDAETSVEREWLLITLRSAWTVGETTYPAGCLLATRFDDFIAGERNVDVLFEPDAHTSLTYHSWTKDHVILNTLHDVQSRIEVLTPGPDGWQRAELAGVPVGALSEITDTDPDVSDEYFMNSSGYVEPATLRRGVVGGEPEILKQAPARFDAADIEVHQHFATSADGTKIPYFVVGKPDPHTRPTLLSGYGGFEVSLTPSYLGHVGRAWLARGGTYVVANLRGGGEYGPDWHSQAVKANRHLVYEDFAAVARDLIDRGITTPRRLGIQGGSNGGLLMGVMLTKYPRLFGAIVCQVPLLDMRRYHELLAGASWMAEYGDPRKPEEWAFIEPFSPYQNVHEGAQYPPVLFATSTRDDRVHPGHARKMVARMREQGHDVRYYENIEGGHGAAADNEQLAFKWALVFEFLWAKLS
ncbi:prolyl oligopeptidase family serine peptidase [Kibdelosporangium phytohabitans]|uniref:Prolyl oligopeptidase n=1 Tax=Kibdelosporangium phytohabitans TaxID=860235 RepID=A0A0N9HXG2_9PSEU|nr:prolyl oligopeptidase family serine peptidase [Kibdelosporangium phytohabitans]ALG07920.1 prolyl oligopeptidase [Kibdelosporangium phytohabitans]MBE1471141.1 prolyl oligopeptidase [Kibdelosporangium phytohabitans]